MGVPGTPPSRERRRSFPSRRAKTEGARNGSERSGTCRARVLVADDNADMRAYLRRILEQRYRTSEKVT
jgi:PleD family two-component response regulator